MKQRKGELTTKHLVGLIILIVSFAIILFFIFRLNLGETTGAEICRNSVVQRGSTVLPAETISLNCKRQYLCITEDGTCDKMTNPEIKKVSEIEEVYEILADEMVECWWMFGEGEVNYVGNKASKSNYCSICDQIGFDKSLGNLEEIKNSISKDELYEYMSKNKLSENKEETYTEYFFSESSFDTIKQESLKKTGVDTFGKILIDEQYFVVMGITSEISGWVYVAGAAAAVGGVVAVVAGAPVLLGVFVVGAGVGFAGTAVISENLELEIGAINIKGRGIDNQFMAPTIIEANSDKYKALNCEDVITLS